MPVREVLKIGHPLLRQPAKEVEDIHSDEIRTILDDMRDTMIALNGAGLAAPQIGVGLRIMIFGVDSNPRYPEVEVVPQTTLINPEFKVVDDNMESGWEGCLSVPGYRGLVPRYNKIIYQGMDESGELIEREAGGFHARVFQHEFDHLDGILYPQRIKDMRNFGLEQELFPA